MKCFVGLCVFSLCSMVYSGQQNAPAVFVAPNTISTANIGGPVVVAQSTTTQQLQQTVETSNGPGYVLGQVQQQMCTGPGCGSPVSMSTAPEAPSIGGFDGGRLKKLIALLRFRNRDSSNERHIVRTVRRIRN